MRTRSPFPGMDPYFEDSEIWRDFHHALAEEIRGGLNARIGPKYYAAVEVHTISEDVFISYSHTMYPDVGIYKPPSAPQVTMTAVATIPAAPIEGVAVTGEVIRDRAVRIYVTKTGELVTAIEILSPYNKRLGDGLEDYRKMRAQILKAHAHLVELDFLRGGTRPGPELNEPPLDTDYVLMVNRARESNVRVSEIWPLALDETFPLIPVPLREPDPDVALDLNQLMLALYPRAGYGWRIDYTTSVPPPDLRAPMKEWLRDHITSKEQNA